MTLVISEFALSLVSTDIEGVGAASAQTSRNEDGMISVIIVFFYLVAAVIAMRAFGGWAGGDEESFPPEETVYIFLIGLMWPFMLVIALSAGIVWTIYKGINLLVFGRSNAIKK